MKLLGRRIEVHIDRPLGSVHPEYDYVLYETNYGYIPETLAGDGEEIDAYVLGVDEPLERFEGRCIAVILRRGQDDDEHKLVVAPGALSRERIVRDTAYVESYYDTEVILEADDGPAGASG